MNTDIITLSELAISLKSCIYNRFTDSLWVIAEISELNLNKSGHCYLELIEKEATGIKIITKMRAVIWAGTYRNINSYFRRITGSELKAGIKVLSLVRVEYHEVYGLSLNILDIDPSYTLGDIAKRKQEVIKRLTEEGVVNMNKTIPFPIFPQRIAVISSETAAGYGDFMETLTNNIYGFKFISHLYPAIMQGEQSEKSVIGALDRIFDVIKNYDIAVIIRGGGAQSELDTFNGYDLAFHITQFPIPVITGIGHERDETVADFVANTSLKTPTAVAEYIISTTLNFSTTLNNQMIRLTNASKKLISNKIHLFDKTGTKLTMIIKNKLNLHYNRLSSVNKDLQSLNRAFLNNKMNNLIHFRKTIGIQVRNKIKQYSFLISVYSEGINKHSVKYILKLKNDLNILEKGLDYLNPVKILERGYTITSSQGKIMKKSAGLNEGDIIDTLFIDGKISSRIEKFSPPKK